MTFQIFSELKPTQYVTVLMYTSPGGSNSGAQGSLLIVNQGNPEVNSGNIDLDLGRDSDYIRVGISNSSVLSDDGFIAYDTMVPPNHMTQLQGLCLSSGSCLFVYSQKGQTSFVYTGTTVPA